MASKQRYIAQQRRQTKNGLRKPLWLALSCCLIGAAVLAVLELTNTTHLFHSSASTVTSSANSNTKGEPASSPTKTTTSQNGTSTSTNTNSINNKTGNQTPSGTVTNILTPSGDFVSAHHVGLNSVMASVCNTSPGVSCTISFNSNGTTKSLTTKTTDDGGSAYWDNWTPKSIGLTAGSWQVKATSSSGDQSKTATDATSLEVSE